MKKQLLSIAIALMAIVTSCEEKGGDGQKISLHSLNVADAQSIFKKTGEGTKSGSGEESYWKIDKSGKESKLVLSDANGTNQGDVKIISLLKLSDEILLLNIRGRYTSIMEDEGGEYETTTWKDGLFFANTKTERLFELPGSHGDKMWDDVWSLSSSDYVDVKEDKDGMIYMKSRYKQIIKLDTRSYTLSYELPDNQDVMEFDVTSEGFIP